MQLDKIDDSSIIKYINVVNYCMTKRYITNTINLDVMIKLIKSMSKFALKFIEEKHFLELIILGY